MKAVLLLWLMSFAFVPLIAQTQSSGSEKRLALVIGNSHYTTSSVLPTTLNDARDIAATLKDLGFDVMLYTDLDKKSMRKAVDEFGTKLKGYQVGLFFYAGHGVALADKNYLVPVDASAQTAGDIEFDCFPADLVLAKMDDAQASTNIIIFDADRSGPSSAGSFQRGRSDGGLATAGSTAGNIIAYATSPGGTLVESAGRNGVYTAALLDNLKTPGLPVEEVLSRTRRQVMKQTNNQQRPWETSSLTQDFYFLRHN